MDEERRAKVVIVGDMGVGKTCSMLQFTENKFPSCHISTIGKGDFRRRTMDVDNKKIVLEIWDTAGQERYKSLTSKFFRNSNGVLLIFDVTNLKSFSNLPFWLNELDYHGVRRGACLLVGNKIDMANERVVEHSQVTTFARHHDLTYTEISAKENRDVHEAFATLARQMMDAMKTTERATFVSKSVVCLTFPEREGKGKKKKCVPCRS